MNRHKSETARHLSALLRLGLLFVTLVTAVTGLGRYRAVVASGFFCSTAAGVRLIIEERAERPERYPASWGNDEAAWVRPRSQMLKK